MLALRAGGGEPSLDAEKANLAERVVCIRSCVKRRRGGEQVSPKTALLRVASSRFFAGGEGPIQTGRCTGEDGNHARRE